MYTLIREGSIQDLLVRQGPTLIASLVIAELFFKFGSFLLEVVAFLATWFVLDAATYFFARRHHKS
jgi:hypothetical protein